MNQRKFINFKSWTWTIIYFLLFVDIIVLISFYITDSIVIITRIYLLMFMYSISSALIVMVLFEIFNIKRIVLLSLMKYKKKPRLFEFGFFFFSFLAVFFSILSAGIYGNAETFLSYLQNSWFFMAFYGVAFACGWYHYILRVDY